MSLFYSPITIKNLTLSNRLVMPPMATEKADRGMVGESLFQYYDLYTKGGNIGLVIIEHSYINPAGQLKKGQVSIADDSCIAGLKKLVDVIHLNNTKVIAQINHAGGAADTLITGLEVLAPSASAIPRRENNPLPKAMNQTDIDEVISDFTKAALRAKEAGFDGVEIHSAHGYLLNQFYSPLTNKRLDSYSGKNIVGRIKLHLEIIRSIRAAVGDDYLIALRLGACDYLEGGSTLEDGIYACKAFEKEGVNLLDISGGHSGYVNPYNSEEGYFKDVTNAIMQQVSIPVILTGGIVTPAVAEQLLKEGNADLIGVGRAILKDSSWPAKAAQSLK